MSGALTLAAAIAAMDEHTLRTLAFRRRIATPDAVNDPLSLALELLRPESITRAVQSLDRSALRTLLNLADEAEEAGPQPTDLEALRQLGLVGVEHSRIVGVPEVTQVVRTLLPDGLPGSTVPGHDPQSPDTRHWFAPALASVRRTAALLRALADRPATLNRNGSVTVIALRELAATAVIGDPTRSGFLLASAQRAGLTQPVTVRGRRGQTQVLRLSSAGEQWLSLPLHARWVQLAAAALSAGDSAVYRATELADGHLGHAVQAVLPYEYPLLPAVELETARIFADTAEELGATVSGVLTEVAQALLDKDIDRAYAIAERDFPPIVPGVYLQPDLSLIAPGPLAPADEQALSVIADAEQWGVAITMRLSPASLQRAAQSGMSTGAIRQLLNRLSLTGIPQPLDYLLSDLERSRPATPGAEPLPNGPFAQATLVDDTARSMPAEGVSEHDRLSEMVARVTAAAQESPVTGEVSRMLELAIRDRTTVRLTAEVGGEQRSFVLMPVAISGGRLRATDEQAEVQRTLPLTAIVGIEPA